MTSEQKVKQIHPKAVALYGNHVGYWGIFFDGGPKNIGVGLRSGPDASGYSASNAWVNARKKLEKAGSKS